MIRPRIVALLGLASGLDYAAQVLVPILLVRVLSAHDFGGYRLLWLAAQTCANILSMSVRPSCQAGAATAAPPAAVPCSATPLPTLQPLPCWPPWCSVPDAAGAAMYAGGAVDAWLPPLFSALWLVVAALDYVALACHRPTTRRC